MRVSEFRGLLSRMASTLKIKCPTLVASLKVSGLHVQQVLFTPLFFLYVAATCTFRRRKFLFLLVVRMAALGEANARINSLEANLANGLDDHSALASPIMIADMQHQIRENNTLVQALREELRQSSLAKSSFAPSSPSLSTPEPPEDLTVHKKLSRRTAFPSLQRSQVLWVLTFMEALSVLLQALALMWNPICHFHRWTLTRLVFLRTYRSSQISWSCLRGKTTQQVFAIWVSNCFLLGLSHRVFPPCLPRCQFHGGWRRPTTEFGVLKTPRSLNSIKNVFKPAIRAWWDQKSSLPLGIRFILRLHTGFMIILSSPPLRCFILTTIYWHQLNLWFPSRLLSHWLEVPSVCCLTSSILLWHLLSSCSSSWRRLARVFRSLRHHVPRCYLT